MQLTLALGNSPRFTGLLVIGGGLAQVGFWSLPGFWAVISGLAASVYLFQQWWFHIGRYSADSIVAVRVVSDNRWQAQFRGGQWSETMELMPGSFCHPLLALFRLQDQNGRRYSLVVPADAVATDRFRRLRVIIAHAGKRAAAG